MTLFFLLIFIPLAVIVFWRFRTGFPELQQLAGKWRISLLKDVFRIKWFITVISLLVILVSSGFAIFDVLPQTEYEPNETIGTEIVFLLDISRSMTAEDILPSRLDKSAETIRSITERSRGIPKSLVIFKGTGLTVVPLTEDNEALYTYLNNISSGLLTSRGTNIEEGIAAALDAFSVSGSKNKYLFIFTDGEALTGKASKLASRIQHAGVEIAIVGVGSKEGSRIEIDGEVLLDSLDEIVITKLDEDRLIQLAQIVNGVYVNISSTASLSELSREAYSEKESFKVVQKSRYQTYLLFALFGLLIYFSTRVIKWKDGF